MNQCVFCEEGLDFSSAKSFLGKAWPYPNRVVYSDSNIFCVVGYSPQVYPYILAVPYRHIYSMTEMNYYEIASFLQCLRMLSNSGAFYSELCFFEHGGPSTTGSSSIDHCHIHIINGNLGFFECECFENYQTIEHLREIEKGGQAYFLLGKYKNGTINMKMSPDTLHEHQYFRKVLARQIGDAEWDWRQNMHFETMLKTMEWFADKALYPL